MKRYRQSRDYDVVVYPKGAKGDWQNKACQRWCLNTTSAEGAKDFATDIISGMSLNEIFGDDIFLSENLRQHYIETLSNRYNLQPDEEVGLEVAIRAFTYDAVLSI